MRKPEWPEAGSRFQELASNPQNWMAKAQLLMRAAELLIDRVDTSMRDLQSGRGRAGDCMDLELFQPAYMLAALALELSLKALILKRHPEVLKGRTFKWLDRGTGHELVELAARADLSADMALLSELEKFLVWKGSYPASKRGETMFDGVVDIINFAGTHSAGVVQSTRDMLNQVAFELGKPIGETSGS